MPPKKTSRRQAEEEKKQVQQPITNYLANRDAEKYHQTIGVLKQHELRDKPLYVQPYDQQENIDSDDTLGELYDSITVHQQYRGTVAFYLYETKFGQEGYSLIKGRPIHVDLSTLSKQGFISKMRHKLISQVNTYA